MKVAVFPPGDILLQEFDEDDPEQANLWRETSFAFHLIKQAVNPELSLKSCIEDWRQISEKLAESPRMRSSQIKKMYSKPCQE
jgi:hypothetical protein